MNKKEMLKRFITKFNLSEIGFEIMNMYREEGSLAVSIKESKEDPSGIKVDIVSVDKEQEDGEILFDVYPDEQDSERFNGRLENEILAEASYVLGTLLSEEK